MAEAQPARMSVSGSGTVIVRQRPSLLLMKLRLRSAEATLELALARVKAQCEATAQWLKRLGATSVEFGQPHFDEHIERDELTRQQTRTARAISKRLGAARPEPPERRVNVVATALWPIAELSPEQTLVLLDRLRFEAAEEDDSAEAAEENPSWENPAEQLRQAMVQMSQPPVDDRAPQFLFIARLSDEQLEKASAEAFSRARKHAERAARAAGLHLGGLGMLTLGLGGAHESGRHDKVMERQRCAVLLSGTSYELGENETAADDPRPAEFAVRVSVHYALEQAGGSS